jgi:hypothetical protein
VKGDPKPDKAVVNGWGGYCLAFVVAAYQSQGVTPSPIVRSDAKGMYRAYDEAGLIQTGVPPRGALVFYPGLTSAGHIAISAGAGEVISARATKRLGDVSVRRNAYRSIDGYVGWAFPANVKAPSPTPKELCSPFAACEGRILVGPDGGQVWIKNGKRYPIQNPLISRCVEVRGGAGPPMATPSRVIDAYPDAGRPAWCPYPEGMLVRGNGQTEVWRVHADGTREHVLCAAGGAQIAEVPAGEPDGHLVIGSVNLCDLEGKILLGSDGTQYWIRGSQRLTIQNPLISNCVQVRASSGAPIPADGNLINSYADAGRPAWCPYPDGMLVRGDNQSEVWRVHADGTREHVTCLPPGVQAAVVPAGEPDGHVYTGDVSLC